MNNFNGSEIPRIEDEEMTALLPFYVTERLNQDDRARIEAWIVANPTALSMVEDVRDEMEATRASNLAISPSHQAFTRLMNEIEAHAAKTRNAPPETALGIIVWLRRLVDRLSVPPLSLGWMISVLLLVALLAQNLYLYKYHGPRNHYVVATDRVKMHASAANAIVIFQPTATAAEISATLQKLHVSIVSGPRADGYYEIFVEESTTLGSLDERIQSLAKQKNLFRFIARNGSMP